MPDQEECYQRIRDALKIIMTAYYRKHPGRLIDDRGAEAIAYSRKGIEEIFAILDDYEIKRKG